MSFRERYKFWRKNGFDVIESIFQASSIKEKWFYDLYKKEDNKDEKILFSRAVISHG